MPHFDSAPDSKSPHPFANALQHITSVITLKRVGLSLAGTFAFVGAATAMNTTPAPVTDTSTKVNTRTNNAQAQQGSADEGPSDASSVPPTEGATDKSNSSSTSYSSTTTNGKTNVQLTVNGQEIPVPSDTTSQQTIVHDDGSQTVVNTHASTNGSTTNASSSTFSLNVSTNSSSGTNKNP